jgi:hypothetical protein
MNCTNHPDRPDEWMGFCQECWEQVCADGWWKMLAELERQAPPEAPQC